MVSNETKLREETAWPVLFSDVTGRRWAAESWPSLGTRLLRSCVRGQCHR